MQEIRYRFPNEDEKNRAFDAFSPVFELDDEDEVLVNNNGVIRKIKAKNFSGKDGKNGKNGERWPQGEKWDRWEKWEAGEAWPVWPRWEKWEQWIQGERWVPGPRWEAWPKWEKGEKWEKWETGPAGAGTGDLLSKNNLSDLADRAVARNNLQVYSKAEVNGKIPTLPDLSSFLQKTEFQSEKNNFYQKNWNNPVQIPHSTNLNDFISSGFYRWSNLVNKPVWTTSRGYVEVMSHWTTWVMQKYYELAYTRTHRSYVRFMENWTWQEWKELLTTENSEKFTSTEKNNLAEIVQGLPSLGLRIWTLEKDFWTQKTLIDAIPETYATKADFVWLDNKFLKKSEFDSRISNFATWFKLIFDSGNLTWYNWYWSQSYTVIHNLGLKKEDFLAWKYDIYIALNHNYNWFNLKRLFWWSWQANIRWNDNFQDTNNVEFFINSNKIRFYLNFANDYTIKKLLIFKLY